MFGHNDTFLHAAYLTVLLSAIPLLTAMTVGLIVSVLQAATQIQEQTLSFVPKVSAVIVVLYFVGPWMLTQLQEYMSSTLIGIAHLSGAVGAIW